MLLNLAKQYPCAIVTGRPREDCDYFLKLVGLDQAFTTCVCMEDTEKPKPDPAPVQLALKLLGITGVSDTNGSRSDAIYMFGDTVDDVRASTGAGIVAVGVRLPEGTDDDARTLACAGADVVLDAGMDALNVFPKNDVATEGTSSATKPNGKLSLTRYTPKQVMDKEISLWRASTNPKIYAAALDIVTDVEKNKERALLKYAVRFGDLPSSTAPYVLQKDAMKEAYDRISDDTRSLLDRSAERVRSFAQGQKDSLKDFNTTIQGEKLGTPYAQ